MSYLSAQVFRSCGRRCFHWTAIRQSEVKAMKKILVGSNKKKHRYSETPILPTPSMFSKGTYEGKKSINSKRTTVLNKLFMRYITDLMATGECSHSLVGHNIEINRVQVTPDFACINVYWVAKGTQKDEVVDSLLNSIAGLLRHELSQLKVVGMVPNIKFLKDKQLCQLMELDLRLAIADFGDDYIPSEPAAKLKSQLQLVTKLDPQTKKQVEKLNSVENTDEDIDDVPDMPNNVFGLDHTHIMNRIIKSMGPTTKEDLNLSSSVHAENDRAIEFTSMAEQRLAFKQFLLKRQLLQHKANKQCKNYKPELEYSEEDISTNQTISVPNCEMYDEDYIEEELK